MKHCTVCKAKYEDSVSFCPTDGEVLEDDPSSIVDTVLDGQYQIEIMLGKGGMGAVYRARHILLGDRVAIKVLPPEVRTNADWLRRFRREGQAARRFRHHNAVTVYDLRTASDGTIYMVMEYVEGHTLSEEIRRRGRFTPAEAFGILEPIMSVLNTAHAMGVVHRDLKPENIMIGKASTGGEPVLKLLDLGIAKMREIAGLDGGGGGNTALTMAGQVLGTPYYMSPEQWGEIPLDGDSEIDGRADIYSLGLVVYEMIAGRRPYSGVTLHELRREHVSVVPPPLHEAVPDIPRAFSEAVSRATAKDRSERQASAGQLAEELRAAVGPIKPGDVWGRTIPDLPHVDEANRGQTEVVSGQLKTKSDVNAPTIVTVEAPVTDPGFRFSPPAPVSPAQTSVPPPRAPEIVAQQYASAPSAGAMDMSSATIPQVPKPLTPSQPSRRGPLMAAGAGAFVLLFLIVAVGGFFVYRWMAAKNNARPGETTAEKSKTLANDAPARAAAKDAGRYWLELLPESIIGEPARVAGVVPLASGQSFKFHFVFSEAGYLYIIGPGAQNQATAFLTAKPASISGLETNQVTKGADFSFPSGIEHWLELDKKPGTEDYTIIFSPKPLSSPAFLQEPAGRQLTAAEKAELSSFVEQFQSNRATTSLNDDLPTEQFVSVKVPATGQSGNPITFVIRIEHK
ncbi:MAG: protein kinase domain-containing protein [Pyrinomonadaceae bacterium]